MTRTLNMANIETVEHSPLPRWPARLQADLAAAYVGLFKPDGTPDTATFRQGAR